jgi:hypothetical protein
MKAFIEGMLEDLRTLEQALADLLAEYERNPNPNLARTIELIRDEIELRKRPD